MVNANDVVEAQMWAAVNDLLPTLQPNEQQLVLDHTIVGVMDEPTADQLKATKTTAGHTLLGLCEIFQPPAPARITLFSGPILRSDTDVTEVMQHELGHRLDLGYHGIAGITSIVAGDEGMLCDQCAVPGKPCGCSSKANAAIVLQNYQMNETLQVQAQRTSWSDDCPVCLVWSKLNEADGLLSNASMETSLQHVIPAGLGGTIPLARFRVQQAYDAFQTAASMVDPVAGMTEQLRRSLADARATLGSEGTILSPDQLRIAARTVHQAQLQAFQFTWAFWHSQTYS